MSLDPHALELEAAYDDLESDPRRDPTAFLHLSVSLAKNLPDEAHARAIELMWTALARLDHLESNPASHPSIEAVREAVNALDMLGVAAGDHSMRVWLARWERSYRMRRVEGCSDDDLVELHLRVGDAAVDADDLVTAYGAVIEALDLIEATGADHLLTEVVAACALWSRLVECPDPSPIERRLQEIRERGRDEPAGVWALIGSAVLCQQRGDTAEAELHLRRLRAMTDDQMPPLAWLVGAWVARAGGHAAALDEALGHLASAEPADPTTDLLIEELLEECDRELHGVQLHHVPDRPTVEVADVVLPPEVDPGDPVALASRVASLEALVEARTRQLEQALVDLRDMADRSQHDPLTGLANRTHLRELLAARIASRHSVAVLAIDIDRFTRVNETIGHVAGDALIVEVARRLGRIVSPADTLARWGGDEFMVILNGHTEIERVESVANGIRQALGVPWLAAEGTEVVPSVTIGVALAPNGEIDPDVVLQQVDIALEEAKRAGRGRVEVFGDALGDAAQHRFETESLIRQGMERGWFELFFQPIYSNETGRPYAAESLLRLRHPERGVLAPAAFLDVAEDTGLAVPLGDWVIRSACEHLAAWQDSTPGFRLAVNVSASQLDSNFPVMVAESIDATGADAEALVIELTEHLLLAADEEQVAVLNSLRSMGIRIALDDFGTAYSSFNHLRRFPIDIVKIDRSFVAGICSNPEDLAIVAAVVDLSRVFGFRVIAEGVETSEQLDLQRRLGCFGAQGFLIGRPRPASHFGELLAGLSIVDQVTRLPS